MTAIDSTARHEASAAPQRTAPAEHDRARLAAFAAARRHSSRVRFLKFTLPGIAVAIVASFIGYSFWSMPSSTTLELGEAAFSDGKLVMANPKLEGFTNNRPYTMTAERALQDPKETEVIELEGINARVPVDDENWADIDATSGVFDRKKNTLVVDKPITVITTDGKKALLQSAFVNVRTGMLTTDQPIDISMDGVRVTADSMQVLKNGKVLVFEKKVKMNIEPGRMKTAKAEGDATNVPN
jgi:lipopolysaccharide export system protein LptC